MAQCMHCGKKGFFLIVDKNKLCNNCAPIVKQMIDRHLQIIDESEYLILTSKKFETKISRADVILDNIYRLKDYAQRGYRFEIDLDEYEERFIILKNRLIEEFAQNKVDGYLQKAALAKTLNSKINNANKALIHLSDMKKNYGYENEELEAEIKNFIHKAEYDDLLEKAEKEEFKGNYKKAVDRYKDILFFLRRDDIDDSLQQNEISHIEAKIEELSSKS